MTGFFNSFIFDRYEIIKEIGYGATARVYLAMDKKLGRKAAIKQGRDKGLLLREAHCLSAYASAGFPTLYDYVEGEKSTCLIMEYIAGENLAERFFADRTVYGRRGASDSVPDGRNHRRSAYGGPSFGLRRY